MAPVATANGYGGTLEVDSRHKPVHAENVTNGDASHIWLNNPSPDDIKIREQLLGTKKKMRVCFLGAGVSGLDFFHFAEQKLQNVEIICYEKNADVGGTWYENRYPGCACDIPSVVYQFPWRPAPWSKYYSYSPEIWKYIKMVAEENNFIEKYIKLRHKIQKLSWDDDTAQWTVTVENLATGEITENHFDLVINGGGILNKWKWPTGIEGLHDFKGVLMHSAQYNEGMDLKGKRVALIGAGSSAVQILPNIYNDVSEVYHWIRSKIWITAGFAQAFAGADGANFSYTPEQQKMFEDSDKYKAYCKMIEGELNQRFSFIINGSPEQKAAREFSENEMTTLLKDRPDLLEAIMPKDFFVACRRPTPGNGYLEALTGKKTTAYTEQLKRITPTGFIDPEGKEHEVDVIICATGFDTSYNAPVPVIVNGVDKQAEWKKQQNPPTYLSLAYAGVPNMIVVSSPPSGTCSLVLVPVTRPSNLTPFASTHPTLHLPFFLSPTNPRLYAVRRRLLPQCARLLLPHRRGLRKLHHQRD